MFILLILKITNGTIFIAKRSTKEKGRGMLKKKKKSLGLNLLITIPKAETTFCIMLQSCQDFFFFFFPAKTRSLLFQTMICECQVSAFLSCTPTNVCS